MQKSIRFICFLVAGLFYLQIGAWAWAGEDPTGARRSQKPAAAGEERTPKKEAPKIALPKKHVASEFIRITKDAKGQPKTMQTAIVRYVPKTGKNKIVVDLVSVVHIGERKYFWNLNDKLSKYEAVLYELVAPEGTKVPQGGPKNDSPVAMLQKMITGLLLLDFQLEHVDYTGKNFIHADLSPTEMAKKMKERGDDGLTVALGVIADMLRQQNKMALKKGKQADNFGLGNDPLALLTDPSGPCKIKRMMARQMADMENNGVGKTLTTILIDDRNAACMKVLQKELVKGTKHFAIFYGAAHMPDFERRLIQDFGMRKQSVEWMDAWDLRMRDVDPFELLNRFIK